MSGKRSKIQFIHSPYSKLTRGALVETQRRVHSHAAWAAHAKARQLRVMKFGNVEDGRQPFSNASFNVDTAVMPSPVGLLGSNRRDPFASVARHLNPIEEFCLDYYIQNVVPCSKFPRGQISHTDSGTLHLNKQFVQLATTDTSSLDGLFLVACRHLSQCLPRNRLYFIRLALQYKIACAQSLMEAISSSEMRSPISDSIIILALFLAHDDILIDDSPSTKIHVQGAIQMVRHNSALNKTETNSFLYDLIQSDM